MKSLTSSSCRKFVKVDPKIPSLSVFVYLYVELHNGLLVAFQMFWGFLRLYLLVLVLTSLMGNGLSRWSGRLVSASPSTYAYTLLCIVIRFHNGLAELVSNFPLHI
jgi:hypothetical protein